MRYCRRSPTATTVRSRTDAHWRVICQIASHSSPPTRATVTSIETTIASHRGTRCRSRKLNAGHSSAEMRIAISSGITSSFSWMTIQITSPAAAASTSIRQA